MKMFLQLGGPDAPNSLYFFIIADETNNIHVHEKMRQKFIYGSYHYSTDNLVI